MPDELGQIRAGYPRRPSPCERRSTCRRGHPSGCGTAGAIIKNGEFRNRSERRVSRDNRSDVLLPRSTRDPDDGYFQIGLRWCAGRLIGSSHGACRRAGRGGWHHASDPVCDGYHRTALLHGSHRLAKPAHHSPRCVGRHRLGTLCFGLLDVRWLLLLVGLVAVGFPLLNWSGLSRRTTASSPSVLRGMFWSSLSGFTSFICHSGGPPLLAYTAAAKTGAPGVRGHHGGVLSRGELREARALLLSRTTADCESGDLARSAAAGSAGHLPRSLVNRRCSNDTVYRAANVFLFATGIKLVHDAVAKLTMLH